MPSRENFRPFSLVFALICVCVLIGGCVHPIAAAGRDADAGISAVRTNLRDLNAALVQARSDIRAGGDVHQNDPWTMRFLGIGILFLGLSYPVGKLVWLAMLSVKERSKLSAGLWAMSQRHKQDATLTVDA